MFSVAVSTGVDGDYLKRSHSDHDLYQGRHMEDDLDNDGGAEFYTAVGPDGKEIILRKYLQDQADTAVGVDSPDMRIGFVSQALGHLQQEFGGPSDPRGHLQQEYGGLANPRGHLQQEYGGHSEKSPSARGQPDLGQYPPGSTIDPVHYYQQQRSLLHNAANERDGNRSFRSSFEYPEYSARDFTMDIHGGGDYYDSDEENYRNKNILPVEQKYSNGSYNRSPKHKIRTPIIEETDSIIERELMSRDQSRRFRRRSDSVQDMSSVGENLNLSLSDGRYDGPEPQYTETKSSILRRRHSNAKLSSSQNSNQSTSIFDKLFRKKRRVNSMSDLTSSRSRPSNLRRRNSMSYDDIQRYDDLNQSRSTTLSTKKFTMYTGLSPKEKIEYNDYNDIR